MAGLVPERINTSGHRGGSRAEHRAAERALPPRACAAPRVCEALASPEARGPRLAREPSSVDKAHARRVSERRRSGLVREDSLRLAGRCADAIACRGRRATGHEAAEWRGSSTVPGTAPKTEAEAA